MKVTYEDHFGTDLSVVNSARVSFGKRSEELSEKDKRLIEFLARGCTKGEWEDLLDLLQDKTSPLFYDNEVGEILQYVKKMPTHWAPFASSNSILLHVKAPIFVARQLAKHQVGMEWSEISRRYVTDEPEFYVPDVWRKKAENVKQGSSDETVDPGYTDEELHNYALVTYQDMLKEGVCPEQARMVLPQSMYTEWFWKGNLYSFANVYNQRTDPHSQKETQEIAHQIGDIIEPLFPVSWKELTK
jgi:thymidylate synthase (FAD)